MVTNNTASISNYFISSFNEGLPPGFELHESKIQEFNRSQVNNPDRILKYNISLLLNMYEFNSFDNPIYMTVKEQGVIKRKSLSKKDFYMCKIYLLSQKSNVTAYYKDLPYNEKYAKACITNLCIAFEKYFCESVKCDLPINFSRVF